MRRNPHMKLTFFQADGQWAFTWGKHDVVRLRNSTAVFFNKVEDAVRAAARLRLQVLANGDVVTESGEEHVPLEMDDKFAPDGTYQRTYGQTFNALRRNAGRKKSNTSKRISMLLTPFANALKETWCGDYYASVISFMVDGDMERLLTHDGVYSHAVHTMVEEYARIYGGPRNRKGFREARDRFTTVLEYAMDIYTKGRA